MKTKLLLLILVLPFLTIAQVGNGFEKLPGITFDGAACRYFDANNGTAHELENYVAGCGTIYVKETASAATLGYTITWSPTGGNAGDGFIDGDAFGVASATFLSSENSFVAPEGSQAFFMEDTDGEITMTFDVVDLTGATNPQFSMQYQLESTGYEAADFVKITIVTSNCGSATTVMLLDTTGQDIDDLGIEDSWITLNADLSSFVGCNAQLIVEFSSNSASEEFAIDAIDFTSGMVLTNESFDLDASIRVFPNPSNGKITIRNSGVAVLDEVQISDLNGRVVANYSLNGLTTDQQLDLSSISSGVYLMTISSKNTYTVKKLVIE